MLGTRGVGGVIFCAVLTVLVVGFASGQTVTVDANTEYQTIEGWGTCTGGSLSYDEDWRWAYKYLGCNLLRMPMGKELLVAPDGNYATPVELVNDINSNIAVMDFNTQNVGGDTAIWLSNNALEPERVKIVGSLWSPPHWMKGPTGAYVEHVTGGGARHTPYLTNDTSGDSVGGRLLQDTGNLEQFGRYIAAWAKGFERHFGIALHGVSLQNELAFENPFDSCTYYTGAELSGGGMGPSEQYWQYAGALKAVKDEFEQLETEHGPGFMTTQITGPHHASLLQDPSNPWSFNWQMQFIKAVKDHSDPNLDGFLGIYTNNYSAPAYSRAKMWRAYWQGKDSMPGEFPAWLWAPGIGTDGKQSWNSEAGGHGTDLSGCLDLAQDIHDQMVWGYVSAYLYWQFASGGVEVSSHDLVAGVDLGRPTVSKKYCTAKQFFRCIRPGARRVAATFAGGESSYGYAADPMRTDLSLNVSAYVHDEDETVTIVFVNRRSDQYSATVNVPPLFGITSYSVHRTSSSDNFERLDDVSVSGGQVSVTVPGQSIVTLHGPPLVELLADFDHDDIVDSNDLEIIAADWMKTDRFEGAKDPGMENLVAWWALDDPNDGQTVTDSSGNDHNGVFPAGTAQDPTWTNDGQRGWCLYFGGDDYVDCGGGKDVCEPCTWADFNQSSFTLACWMKQTESYGWANFVSKGEIHWKLQMLMIFNNLHFAFPRAPGGGIGGARTASNNQWYHVAGVWDDDNETAYVYRNGMLDGTLDWGSQHPDQSGIFVDNDCNVLLGATVSEDYESEPERHKKPGCPIRSGADYAELFFKGYLSDVRMYNRALTEYEVDYLAGGEGAYYPVDSVANVYDAEPEGSKAVNFRDYCFLADEWLKVLP